MCVCVYKTMTTRDLVFFQKKGKHLYPLSYFERDFLNGVIFFQNWVSKKVFGLVAILLSKRS